MPETKTALEIDELRDVIAGVLDVDVAEVTDTADFQEDLEVDSLMALEIMVTLERRYGIKMQESELADVRSLRSTYDLLAAKLGGA